ncbi:MAG: hypothetical protein FLDDKLPJ_00371 [Phycisphaerae bacterium]|nr:hypothetical protein [Phycisphaerae bacterium]
MRKKAPSGSSERLTKKHWAAIAGIAAFCLAIIACRDMLRAVRCRRLLAAAGAPAEREAWALRLADCGRAAIPHLRSLLQDADPDIRLAAVLAAERVPDAEVEPWLIARASDDDAGVREAAFSALARIASPTITEALADLLFDADEDRAMQSAHALAEAARTEAWAALRRALREHPSPRVRAQAIELIAAALALNAAPEVLSALDDADLVDRPTLTQQQQRRTAEQASAAISRQLGGEGAWTLDAFTPRPVCGYAADALAQWTGQIVAFDPADAATVEHARRTWRTLLDARTPPSSTRP